MPIEYLPDLKPGRSLITEARLGRGTSLKALRDAIALRPQLRASYLSDRQTELDNLKHRNAMMWVKDANSRVRRVDTDFRERCTYTDPTHTRTIPDRKVVALAKVKLAAAAAVAPSGNILVP